MSMPPPASFRTAASASSWSLKTATTVLGSVMSFPSGAVCSEATVARATVSMGAPGRVAEHRWLADALMDSSIAGDEPDEAGSETTHAPRRSLQQGERTVGGSAPHRRPFAPVHGYDGGKGPNQPRPHAHGPGAGRLQASAALPALRSR